MRRYVMESGSWTGNYPPCSRTVASEAETWSECFKQGGKFKWQDVLVWPGIILTGFASCTDSHVFSLSTLVCFPQFP